MLSYIYDVECQSPSKAKSLQSSCLQGPSHQFKFGQKWYGWKEKNKKRTADSYFIFLFCLCFLIQFNKTAVLHRNQPNTSDICGDTLANRPRGYPRFLLAGDMLKNAPSGSSLLFEHFPKCIRNSVKVAEIVSNTF
jgi:hypothetical protein